MQDAIEFLKTDNFLVILSVFVLLLIMSGILGWLFSLVPVIISPMVNYIGVPLIQIIVVIIIAVKSNKKKKET